MSTLYEELQGLAREVDEAQADLIRIARYTVEFPGDADGSNGTIHDAVKALDAAERALGLKTAQLLRTGQALPLAVAPSFSAPPGLPEDRAAPPPKPRNTCSMHPCTNWQNLARCNGCDAIHCPGHQDPAMHACGEDFTRVEEDL